MGYRIGLDVGIASVGWSTVETLDGQASRIRNLGVRIFDKPENPKDGASLALPRREKRSMRRRLRRHRFRIERIKHLIERAGLLTLEEIGKMYLQTEMQPDVYALRTEALSRRLTNEEFVRVLIHIAQRRGYKSNRKSEETNTKSDEGKILVAVNQNEILMKEKGYRTVGEMLYLDDRFKKTKRNKAEDYSHTLPRNLVEQEITLIFEAQKKHGNQYVNEDIETKYLNIVTSQRSFDSGPGGNSPYAGNQIEKMLGTCTFEPNEKRAVKASYSFERFMLLTKVNNLRIRKTGGVSRRLTLQERTLIIDEAYRKDDFKYSSLRKLMNLSSTETFGGLTYGRKTVEDVEKTVFVKLKAFHQIRKALNKIEEGYIAKLSTNQLDEIGYALTVFKNDRKIMEYLKNNGLDEESIERLLLISFSGTGHLSIKAIRKLINFLESGMDYDKACAAAGYDFKGQISKKTFKLPPMNFENITNPVVKRALSQAIKVVNAIIEVNGSPEGINVELAREMSKTFKERKELEKGNMENNEHNERIKTRLTREFGLISPKGNDIVKLKLYEEQDGYCLYSGQKMNIRRLFEDGYADVDHVIPYSMSFNDSYNNKVLVLSKENRQKGNRLPWEYLTDTPSRLDVFVSLVQSLKLNYNKSQNLLKKSFSREEVDEFKERNLNDTRYITRHLAEHIRNSLIFDDSCNLGIKKVTCLNGPVTSYMRKRWGLSKVRENGDLHHALDAVVIACVDDNMIQKISQYHKHKEQQFMGKAFIVDRETGEMIDRKEYDRRFLLSNTDRFPEPWSKFRKELEARLSNAPMEAIASLRLLTYPDYEQVLPVFVSRAPRRKSKGQGHLETVYSPKLADQGLIIKKIPLTDIKFKDGEIENYFMRESDLLLYKALCARLVQYHGDAKKAFTEPFFKPKSDGSNGHLVKKIKVLEKSNLGVFIHNKDGYAANGNMVRIDVFTRNGKFCFVPIYSSDTVKSYLPNKAVVANKPYDQWIQIDNTCIFKFSLYPNDLIKFEHKTGIPVALSNGSKKIITNEFVYFRKASISSGSITVISHDNSFEIPSLGIATLLSLEKWLVDYLGNLTSVKKEKRMDYTDRKSG